VPAGVATGVGVGRADGATVGVGRAVGVEDARAEGAGDAGGLAAGVDDGRTDGDDDGPLVGRSSPAVPDGLSVFPDEVSAAEAAGLADTATLPGVAGLAGGGVAWHEARRAASPSVAAARTSFIAATRAGRAAYSPITVKCTLRSRARTPSKSTK